MKERFEEMELELFTFGASDVIATSGDVIPGGPSGNEDGGDDE